MGRHGDTETRRHGDTETRRGGDRDPSLIPHSSFRIHHSCVAASRFIPASPQPRAWNRQGAKRRRFKKSDEAVQSPKTQNQRPFLSTIPFTRESYRYVFSPVFALTPPINAGMVVANVHSETLFPCKSQGYQKGNIDEIKLQKPRNFGSARFSGANWRR